MKTYLLSAAAVIFLSVIVSLLIPEGKLHKTITFIMRLVCIAVLVQPVKGIFDLKPTGSVDNVDYTFIAQTYTKGQSTELEKRILEKFGVKSECNVPIEYKDNKFYAETAEVKIFSENFSLIDGIYEYLFDLGYINITVYARST